MATITAPEALAATSPDEPLYEVVRGQRVELPPMGTYATRLVFLLMLRPEQFVRDHALGQVDVEMLFVLDKAEDPRRRPDVPFVS